MKRWYRGFFFVFLLGLFTISFSPGVAQAQGTGAQISGTVTDASGAPLPGVKITLTNQDSGVTRVLTSGTDGRYDFVDLANGRYSLQFEHNGFATQQVSGIVLNIGTNIQHDLQMKLGAVQQQVVVRRKDKWWM